VFASQIGPCHVVLDRDPAPTEGDAAAPPPTFGPCLLWPNKWMDRDATWHEGRLRPRRHCVRWGPSSFLREKAETAELLLPVCTFSTGSTIV